MLNTRRSLSRFLLALLTILTLSIAPCAGPVLAADAADAKSDTRNVRLIKPYSDLKDLTPDQTEKLKTIHKKYLDQIKTLEAEQDEELMAVLNDAQKKELSDAKSQEKVSKKSSKSSKAPPSSDGASKDPTAPEPKNPK